MLPVRYFVGSRERVGRRMSSLRSAIQHILDDKSFNILVDPVTEALKIAKQVLEWASEKKNQRVFNDFEGRLLSELKKCFFQA